MFYSVLYHTFVLSATGHPVVPRVVAQPHVAVRHIAEDSLATPGVDRLVRARDDGATKFVGAQTTEED